MLKPPAAIELEETVISAMLVDKNAIYTVADTLKEDCFYDLKYKLIFSACIKLFEEDKPVDLLTVSDLLKKQDYLDTVGGDIKLIEITQKFVSAAHLDYHCFIILQKYIKRQLIKISNDIMEKSYKDDNEAPELLESAFKELGEIVDTINVRKTKNFADVVKNYLNNKEINSKGSPSSIKKINNVLNGYQNSDLIILAGRPGMGKTAFVLNEILASAKEGIPVAFFSLEMSTQQIIARLLSIESEIEIQKILRYNLSESETMHLKKCIKELSKLPIIIDDSPRLSPTEMKIKLSKFKRESLLNGQSFKQVKNGA